MYCDWPRLGRCCFCMPLRRGVLTCAYINLFFSAFMLGLYCYVVHYAKMEELLILGSSVSNLPAEVCIFFYLLELVFNALLIYGAHKKVLKYVQVFFCYTIVTCVALVMIQIIDILCSTGPSGIEKCVLAFAGVCLQIYLITLVRSLIQKLEESGPHTYENQLQPIANGDLNFFSAVMLGLYCYVVHYAKMEELVIVGSSVSNLPAEVCIFFYLLELVFNALLIYGAHKKVLKYVQVFLCYTVVTCVALVMLQIIDILNFTGLRGIEKCVLSFAGVCLQIYLITLLQSLIQKLEESCPHTYENKLNPIANGDLNVREI